ncbi:unnamed protein product [Porites lobata]|uniref:Strawberry notch AAA domain-containing protein n=1 Tax=Porites lobata TaxID=104759 RepID=A0ABN8RC03_9CNID|nr:unnamed protein product [Porites lobata]
MALSSPESPVPPRWVVINRTENPSEEHEELNKMAHGVVAESRSEDVFSSYACNSLNHKGIKHHPGDIVEAGCWAIIHSILPEDSLFSQCSTAQQLPRAKYQLFKSLPQDLVETGKLSDLQLEGVLYAVSIIITLLVSRTLSTFVGFCIALSSFHIKHLKYLGKDGFLAKNKFITKRPFQLLWICGSREHQMVLANGQRAGFFIGDGAGVGKGRQIAGIVLDNFERGRSRHIWFSLSADLRLDAQRDLHDIGCFVKVIDGCQQLDKETRVFGLPADFKEGVVFSTYATLVSSVQKGERAVRLQQLIDWCGGEQFNGCLIFDECHKAKHFVPVSDLQ